MNKKELIDAVAANVGATKKQVGEILDNMFETIVDTVSSEEDIRIHGFGTFENVTRSERTGVNPQTGEKITIPSRKTVRFKASKVFKDIVA